MYKAPAVAQMYKPSTVCVTGAHWDGADMKYGLTHQLLLALMQSQEDIFHAEAAAQDVIT